MTVRRRASIERMTGDDRFQDLMRAAWMRNRDKLVARLDRILATVPDVERLTPDALHTLRSDLHALIGALGTYGYDDGSRLLSQVQLDVVNGRSASYLVPQLERLRASLLAGQPAT